MASLKELKGQRRGWGRRGRTHGPGGDKALRPQADVDLQPKGLGKPLKGLREGLREWAEGERASHLSKLRGQL